MANKLLLRRGSKVNLPTLDVGELAYTTDTKQVFIGSATGNVDISSSIISVTSDSEVIDENKIYSVNGTLKYLKNGVVTEIASGGSSSGGVVAIESEGVIGYDGTATIKVYCSSIFNNNISNVTVNDDSATYTIKVSSPTTGSATWSFVSVSSDKTYITLQATTQDITEDCEITITIPKYYIMFASDNCTCSVWAKYKEIQYNYTVYDRAYYAYTNNTSIVSANASLTSGMNNQYSITGTGSKLPSNITRNGYKRVYTNAEGNEISEKLTQDTTAYIKWVADTDNGWFTATTPTALTNLKITNSSHSLSSMQNLSYKEIKLPTKNVTLPTNSATSNDTVTATTLDHNLAMAQFDTTSVLIESLRSAGYSYVPSNSSNTNTDSSYSGGDYNYYWKGYSSSSSSSYSLYPNAPTVYISVMSQILVCNAMTSYYNANKSADDTELTYAYTTTGTSSGTPITTYAQACTWVKSQIAVSGGFLYVSGSTGFRLPTLAEWMYATKCLPEGNRTSDYTCSVVQSSYPQFQHWLQVSGGTGKYSSTQFTTDCGNYAWYSSNSSSYTHDVGTKLANGIGAYDMCGNVWKWIDQYCSSSYRNLWGGYWSNGEYYLRLGYCSSGFPYYRNGSCGFRVVRSL